MKRLTIGIILVSAMLCFSEVAEKKAGMWFYQAAGVSVNPLGLELDSRFRQVVPLIKKPGILWESTKLDVGVQNSWTPTDNFFGARVLVEPVAFFELTGSMGLFVLYDFFGKGYYPFTSPEEDYHRTALNDRYATTKYGWKLSLEPTLKFKVNKLMLANAFAINHIMFDTEDYYLEYRTYTIHEARDTDIANTVFALWEIRTALLAGINYRFLRVFGIHENSHRISVMAVLLPKVKYLQNLRVVIAAGGYVDDPLFEHKPFVGVLASTDIKIERKQTQ